MPPSPAALTLIRRAAALTRATPGRLGHTLVVPGGDVLVAGDLHGHVPHLRAVVEVADLAAHPARHLVIQEVIHSRGRYPNGGDPSHQAVDLFCGLKTVFPDRVHMIPGNHELAQWSGRPVVKGDVDQNARFRSGVMHAFGSTDGPAMYGAYLDLFRALPLVVRCPNGVVVSHSLPDARSLPGFDPARLLADEYSDADVRPGGTVHSLLWGRDTSERTADDYLRKMDADLLVSGHIACPAGFAVPNRRQVIVDAADAPAGYALFPADKPLTHAELVACLRTL